MKVRKPLVTPVEHYFGFGECFFEYKAHLHRMYVEGYDLEGRPVRWHCGSPSDLRAALFNPPRQLVPKLELRYDDHMLYIVRTYVKKRRIVPLALADEAPILAMELKRLTGAAIESRGGKPWDGKLPDWRLADLNAWDDTPVEASA